MKKIQFIKGPLPKLNEHLLSQNMKKYQKAYYQSIIGLTNETLARFAQGEEKTLIYVLRSCEGLERLGFRTLI